MTIQAIFNKSLKNFKRNSPEILTGLSVVGVIVTGLLAARAAVKLDRAVGEVPPEAPLAEKIKRHTENGIWTLYIPPVLSGAATITCIVCGNKAAGNRTAAAVAAYSITQKAFDEYKEHVIDQIGQGKEQKIRDDLAQKKVTDNPPESKEILVVGRGEVLCCELLTGRYFKCDMESLRRAENEVNFMVNNSWWVSLSEFYDIIGLPHTSDSDNVGWDSDKLLKIEFSAVLTPSEKLPCMAFDYNYLRDGNDRNKYK